MRSTLLALLLTLPAAPAPRPRSRPVPPVTPGIYVMTWGGMDYGTTLHADGNYATSALQPHPDRPGRACRFWGLWRWDQRTHTFHVHETYTGDEWSDYSFRLDAQWRSGTYIRLRKVH